VRITDLKTYVMGTAWRNLIFIEVETDEGLTGVGEATLHNFEEAMVGYLEALKDKYLIGRDPFDTERLTRDIQRDDFWVGGPVGVTGASAVEIACWDIIGQATGQPVYRLLGGACHTEIPAYANGWYQVDRDGERFAERAREVVAMGYRAVKVDPFGAGDYELSLDEKRRSVGLIETIRAAVGPDIEILVEGHGRFAPQGAVEMARLLDPYRPGWFEEPVQPDYNDALAKAAAGIRSFSDVPIATGERIYTRRQGLALLQTGAVDIFQPDPLHCGGLLNAKKLAALADAHQVLVAMHDSNGPVCTAAALHVHATLTNLKLQESFDAFVEPVVREAVIGAPVVEHGVYQLPTAPGLGVTLNHAVITANPYRKLHFNLFADDWQRRQA
jgi:galactonate dehydratase